MRLTALLSACAFIYSACAAYADAPPTPTEASVAELITGMTRMGRCGFPSFSPDDKTMCFVSNMSGSPQLWTVPVGGGSPTQITWSKQPVIGEIWSPKSDWIAFLAGAGDRELYVVKADGTGQRGLGIQCFLSNWSPDGKNVFVGTEGKSLSVNPLTGEAKIFGQIKESKNVAIEDISNDGKYAILNTWGVSGDSDLHLLNLKTGESKKLTPHEGKAENWGGDCNRSHPLFSTDGRTIYFISNVGRKNNGLAKIELAEDGTAGPIKFVAVRDDGYGAHGFAVDDQVKSAAVAWSDESNAQVSIVDLISNNSRTVAEIPIGGAEKDINEISMSHDGQTVAVTARSKVSPTDIFLFDNGSSKWTQLTHSQHPGVNLAKLVTPSEVTFSAPDGSKLTADLLMPPNASGPVPFVIALHGLDNSAAENEALVECGFGVLQPKLPTIHDRTDKLAAFNEKTKHIKDWVDYVVQKGYANPKRIGITGTFGCDALAAVAAYPDLFAACVARSNWVDYTTLMKNSSNKDWLAKNIGTPEQSKELTKKLSPIESFNNLKTAVMLQHGAQDSRTPIDQVHELESKLKKSGTPVETVILADEGNVILKPDNQVKCTTELVDFFSKYLQPDNRITIR